MITQVLRSAVTRIAAGTLATTVLAGAVYGGPPLVIDDTGIVPLNEWQFILSVQGESRPSAESRALPSLEMTYGFYEDMNITGVVVRQYLEEPGEPARTGWGQAVINYKWLFYDNDRDSSQGITLAISPVYSFPLTTRSRIRGLAEDVRLLNFPVLGQFVTGNWDFVGSLAYDYASGSGSSDGISYGVIAAYNVSNDLQLMGEVYGAEFSGDGFEQAGMEFDEGFVNWRLGLLWQVGAGYSILAAYGGPIDSTLPAADKLDYDFFVGLQYDTE